MNNFQKVYKLTSQIPKGKVTTYGEIGKILRMYPRVVGYALHANPDNINIPCHRVVNRNGRIAVGYAFGGKDVQKKRLEEEGISFVDKTHVDLEKHFFKFKDQKAKLK